MEKKIGYFFVVIGTMFTLNAIFVGSHGFGSGLGGVIVSVIAGLTGTACGVWIIIYKRFKNNG